VRDINIVARVTGGVFMGGLHMFNFTEISVNDLRLKFEIGVENDGKASFWQVHGVSEIDFKNIHIGTDSMVFNAAIDVFHQVLVMYLKADEKGYKSAIKKSIEELNILLRTRQSVMLPAHNHHLFNITIPTAPILDSETQIAEVSIDGTLFDTYLKTSHVEGVTTKAKYVDAYPGSQVFVHQSAVASYFYSVYDEIMPVKIDDVSTSLEVIAEFPEIKAHYNGHGTAVNISITASPASGKFLSFSQKDGFVVGRDDDFYLTLELYCSNEAQNRSSELCVVCRTGNSTS
jgi:hypothetical protein